MYFVFASYYSVIAVPFTVSSMYIVLIVYSSLYWQLRVALALLSTRCLIYCVICALMLVVFVRDISLLSLLLFLVWRRSHCCIVVWLCSALRGALFFLACFLFSLVILCLLCCSVADYVGSIILWTCVLSCVALAIDSVILCCYHVYCHVCLLFV